MFALFGEEFLRLILLYINAHPIMYIEIANNLLLCVGYVVVASLVVVCEDVFFIIFDLCLFVIIRKIWSLIQQETGGVVSGTRDHSKLFLIV